MKRTLSLIMAILLCLSTFAGVAFAAELPFPDVAKNAWYYEDVKIAYETQLINGRNGMYYPDDNMTYAEAIKLAACMYQRYTEGAVTLANSSPNWYQSYVDYAKAKGIISKDYAWSQAATRAGYMEMFAKALPDSALPAINNVPDGSIPDVPMTHPQAWAIYKLYRAGILQGDTRFNCNPASSIKRSEVAAILTRMMNTDKRKLFSLGETVQPLTVIVHPQSTNAVAGAAVTLTTAVSGGKAPYTYSWQFKNNSVDWTADTGSTNNTITKYFNASQLAAGLQYRCVIKDSTGATVTTNAALISTTASSLTITQHPQSVTAVAGASTSFTVAVSGGTAPYTYQWQYKTNTTDWANDTSSTTQVLTKAFNASQLTSGLQYRCVIKDAAGQTVTSNTAAVTVATSAMTITQHPQSVTAVAGVSTSFSVAVSGGTAPYTYQWQYKTNTTDWANDTSSTTQILTKTFNASQLASGLKYRCVIKDALGQSVISYEASVTTVVQPLVITTQPQSVTAKVGDTVNFSVAVSGGTAPYTYQWETQSSGTRLWVKIQDAIGSTCTFKPVAAGTGSFRCVITDAASNTVTSSAATLTATAAEAPLVITQQPQNVELKLNQIGTISVEVSGGKAPYTYKWQSKYAAGEWKDASGSNSTYTLLPKTTDTIQYRCIITDAAGKSVTSNAASMIVITTSTPPTITQQPKSMTWKEGQRITLNCNATSVIGGVLGYFWYVEGQSGHIWMSFDGSLTLYEDDWESYYNNGKSFKVYCEVLEEGGSKARSSSATITLEQAPLKYKDYSSSRKNELSNEVTLTATFEGGTEPYKFEWYYITGNQSTSAGWRIIEDAVNNGILTIVENKSYGDAVTLRVMVKGENGVHIMCVCEDADGTRKSTHAIMIPYVKPNLNISKK